MTIIEIIIGYLLGIFSLLWIYQLWDRRNRHLPPGPLRLPLLGNIWHIRQADGKYSYKAVAKLGEKYGDIISLKLGVLNAVVINGYDTIKKALNGEDFLNRNDMEWMLHRSFGKKIGLFDALAETWKPTRRFTMRYLRDFGFGRTNFLQKFLDIEMEDLTRNLDQAIERNNGIIKPHALFRVPSVNIVWASAANTRFDHKDPQITQLVNLIADWLQNMSFMEGAPVAYPFLLKWFPNYFSTKILYDIDDKMHIFFKGQINEIRERGTYKTDPESFIEAFLQHMESDKIKTQEDREVFNGITFVAFKLEFGVGKCHEEVLIIILYDLFLAGSDTTSSTMAFALQKFAMYPEVQEKLRRELQAELGNARLPILLDRASLPYARATILELHRHNHLVPLIARKVYRNTAIDKYVIPKGSMVIFNMYAALMDKGFWGDPENFRPSRFLDNENNIINAERVISFATGKRNCIGEIIAESTIFTFVTQLIQKYEFLPAKPGQVFVTDPIMGLVLSPEKYEIKVRRRQ